MVWICRPRTERDWVNVGILTVLGLLMIWWAANRFTDIRRIAGSEFRYPRAALLFYLLSLVGAGVVFGIANSFGSEIQSSRRRAIALWSLLPFLVIGVLYSILGFGLPGGSLSMVLTNPVTHIASCLVLGFFCRD